MKFPVYRKLSGGQKYYCILSESEWEEAYFLGNRLIQSRHQVSTFVDRNHLQDLLDETSDHVVSSSEDEWKQILKSKKKDQ